MSNFERPLNFQQKRVKRKKKECEEWVCSETLQDAEERFDGEGIESECLVKVALGVGNDGRADELVLRRAGETRRRQVRPQAGDGGSAGR